MDNPAPPDPDAMYRRSVAPQPALPPISDYWPDAPHRIGPPADHYSDEPTESAVDALLRSGNRTVDPGRRLPGPPPRRRSRRPAVVLVALAVLLVAGAGVVGYSLTREDGRERPPDAPPPAAAPVPEAATPEPVRPAGLTAPVDDRAGAGFELVSDTATIELRAADLGGDLYRISTPAGSSVAPRAEVKPAGVRLFLDDTGERGDAAVTVLLNDGVRWRLKVSGGIKAGVFDLGGARVDGVDFAGDAARIDLTLPRPDGTLPIRVSGGVNRFEVSTGRGVPVRVRTRGGAGQVKLDGRTDDGVARGASFLSPDWVGSENRIDLDAVAGVGSLRVGRG